MHNPVPQFRQHPRVVGSRPQRQKVVETMMTAFIVFFILYLVWMGYIFPTYEPTYGEDTAVYLGLMFIFALSMMIFGATVTLLILTRLNRRPARQGGQHG